MVHWKASIVLGKNHVKLSASHVFSYLNGSNYDVRDELTNEMQSNGSAFLLD